MTLREFFREHPKAALAFSGGVDSAYLLHAARSCGADVRPYCVQSAFQPAFELEDARRLAGDVSVLTVDVLSDEQIAANPQNRCYYCKRRIFSAISGQAKKDGYDLILDGTNATDDDADRPGMRALRELGVLSPLRLCGLGKPEIRRLSREAGLFTWDKPAYACLATRIPTGERITQEKLARTERAEAFLFSLGFTDFRVRTFAGAARIQVPSGQMEKLLENRALIEKTFKTDYDAVLLDLEARDEP
jgi:uncharacterized protein